MKKTLPLILTLLAFAYGPAKGAEYGLMGQGAISCGEFAHQYAANPQYTEQTFFAWAQGFMSGLNVGADAISKQYRNLASIPTDEQMLRIREYCDAHPLVDYDAAVSNLYYSIPVSKYK